MTNETEKQRTRSVIEEIDDIRRKNSKDKSKIARCRQSAKVSMSHVQAKQSLFLKDQMDMEELLDKTPYNRDFRLSCCMTETQKKEKNTKKQENLVVEMTKWYSTARMMKR